MFPGFPLLMLILLGFGVMFGLVKRQAKENWHFSIVVDPWTGANRLRDPRDEAVLLKSLPAGTTCNDHSGCTGSSCDIPSFRAAQRDK